MTCRPEGEMLPAYLMDLLEAPERERVEAALARDPELRGELEGLTRLARSWARDDREHPADGAIRAGFAGTAPSGDARRLLEHLLDCEDCRLAANVLRAAPDAGAPAAAVPARRGGIPRLWWLAAAAPLAASLILVVALGLGGRAPGAASALPIDLRARRSDAPPPAVFLSRLHADGISLRIETRVPAGRARWEVTRRDGTVAASGELELEARESDLRSLALFIPRRSLTPGMYWLHVRSADGSVDRGWNFSVYD